MTVATRFPGPATGRVICALAALLFAVSALPAEPLPIFDAHLHYNDEATAVYPLAEVLRRFRANGVATILATSRPNDGTRALVASARADPRSSPRVVPFVRPYRNRADVATWFNDPEIFALVESELKRDIGYRGIGEFHVFGRDAGSGWVKRIVALAVERRLWLHAHCDDAALEILFAHDPAVRIIWAHTGFTTPPGKSPRTWSGTRTSSESCRFATTSPRREAFAGLARAVHGAPGPVCRGFRYLGQRSLGAVR